MPELSHDTAEDGFHEIQLSGKQLVFLFIVTTSVVVGVFLFGVLVGRGAREPRPTEAVPTTSSEASAPAEAGGGPPSDAPPTPAAEEPAPVPTYDDVVNGRDGTAGKSPSAEKPAVPEGRKVAGETPAPAPPEPVPEPTPSSTAGVAVASPKPAGESAPPAARASGTWLVQVIATRDQSVANSVSKKLAGKGYPAFVVSPSAGAAQPFYKVQVGRYGDRNQAEKVSQRIKKEEKFPSWILR